MRKIVVLSKSTSGYKYEIEALSAFADVEFVISQAIEEDDVIADIRDAEVVLFTATKMNARVIGALEKCKLIIRYGIGYVNSFHYVCALGCGAGSVVRRKICSITIR